MFRAGSAQARITPPLGTLLAGHAGAERYASDVRDHLVASAVVLEAKCEYVAIVSCDVLGIDSKSTSHIREAVAKETPIPRTNVLVAATHTHTGPQTIRLFREPEDDYVAWFEQQVVTVVRLAADRMTPASVRTAMSEDQHLCHNRRLIVGGELRLPTQSFDPDDVTEVEGPNDPTLGLLTVRSEGEIDAVVVNYATHAELVTGSQISADFPGWIRRTVQSVYGPETAVLFLPGAIGNLSPTDYRSPERETRQHYTDPEGPRKAREAGRRLGGSIIRTIASGATPVGEHVEATIATEDLATTSVAEQRIERARAVRDDPEATLRETVLADSLLDFVKYQVHNPTVSAEVQALRIGELCIVTFPGEPFAEFGLEVRENREEPVFVAGCTNDWLGYFPTQRAFENGGYETTPGWVRRFERDAGERLTRRALDVIQR